MLEDYPYYVANRAYRPNRELVVYDKYSGEEAAYAALGDKKVLEEAIQAACGAEASMAALRSYERREILEHCVRRFEERFEEFAQVLCMEAGKPVVDARGEVGRLIDTFRIAAGEAERIYGEVIPMDITPRTGGYRGFSKRVPVGACSFITPFNFPLNLVAHKVAPALACGCPFVLKPASAAPLGALMIGEVLSETDLPEGAFSILPLERVHSGPLTTDDRFKLLSFTGSARVGWALKAQAGRKKVVLELGGNAACIVDEDAHIEDAVERICFGAFYQSGQSCISVQRILVHEKIYERFREKFVFCAHSLKTGDPRDKNTSIGPMISQKEAQRLHDWIKTAERQGGTVLCGGGREGATLEATVMENVPHTCDVVSQEAFGPVAVLSAFTDYEAALKSVNDSAFGLQAGVFTRDLYKAHRAWDTLNVGGVVIGDVPSVRVDNMPYGGVKDSGLGREGIRFAMEDMTQIRLMLLRMLP